MPVVGWEKGKMMSYLILSPIFVPIIAGIALLLLPDKLFGGGGF